MIAVTGAAGFIGSCFITKLNNEGYHDILVIDTLQQDDVLDQSNIQKYFEQNVFKDIILLKI